MQSNKNSFDFWLLTEKLPYLTKAGIDFTVIERNGDQSKVRAEIYLLGMMFFAGTMYGMDQMSESISKIKTA